MSDPLKVDSPQLVALTLGGLDMSRVRDLNNH